MSLIDKILHVKQLHVFFFSLFVMKIVKKVTLYCVHDVIVLNRQSPVVLRGSMAEQIFTRLECTQTGVCRCTSRFRNAPRFQRSKFNYSSHTTNTGFGRKQYYHYASILWSGRAVYASIAKTSDRQETRLRWCQCYRTNGFRVIDEFLECALYR
jgi:hypothetical protein